MLQEAKKLHKELVEVAKNDPNIIGLFSTGALGKGMVTENSDYDATMVVKDEVKERYKSKYKGFGGTSCDLSIKTSEELKNAAAWGSSTMWDRYNYNHLKAEIDKTGEIQKLIDEKVMIPSDKREEFVSGSLDNYINRVFRSVKCLRDGDIKASQFEAAESVPPLLDAVFGLEGRVRPFYKYLDWELDSFPLKKLPWLKEEFIVILLRIIQTGDLSTQQMVLQTIEKSFRKKGFIRVFDGWEEMLPWMETFRLK